MRRKAVLAEGVVAADGFVLDVPGLGVPAARDRALALHRPGVQHVALADGRWLVRLPAPEPVDVRRAPGLPVVVRSGALVAAPALDGPAGALVDLVGGQLRTDDLAAAVPIDPVAWVDLGDLPVIVLEPSTAPPPPAAEVDADAPPVDLRSRAKVREPSAKARRAVEEAGSSSASGRFGRAGGTGGSGRGRGSATGTGLPRPNPLRDRLVAAMARSPLGNPASRRYERHLRELAAQFHQRDYEEALRNAIAVGSGGGGSRLTLRPPPRRDELRLRRTVESGARSVAFGGASQQLSEMYRLAARDLESAGRTAEAAFVLAELLGDVTGAVVLLERSGDLRGAAQLAEDRLHSKVAAVRLWWLAGDRERAVWLARRHDAFDVVVNRLAELDPAAASALRLEWVASLERSGAVAAAVAVGWQDEAIRPLLGNLVQRGLDLGGPSRASLLAYQLALLPAPELADAAIAQLAAWSAGDGDHDDLEAFVLALDDARIADPVLDRRVTSAALRAVTALAWPAGKTPRERAAHRLRDRADRILVADLPPITRSAAPAHLHVAPGPEGAVAVHDAVPLPDGRVLVATGAAGCRLLTPDGRTVARWDVPTGSLVASDHGGVALLLAPHDGSVEVHVLDLATRKVRRYGGVRAQQWTRSCDGSSWVVVDERGLAFHDLHQDQPLVAWRELDDEVRCVRVARGREHLAALVLGSEGMQVLRWDRSSGFLVNREAVPHPEAAVAVELLVGGTTHWTDEDGTVTRYAPNGSVTRSQLGAGVVIEGRGDHLVRRWEHDGTWWLDVVDAADEPPGPVVIELGDREPSSRIDGDRLAVWDETGRIVVVDLVSRAVIARLAVTG